VNLRIGDRVVSRAGKVGVVVSTMKIDGELLYIVTWRESKTATACKKQELGLLHGRY
tara:strand:- start:220 stop:390 length:171 start_codon:yes stop_codon:yes gene_type:complete